MKRALKLYFTSDLHGYIYPTDYTNRSEKPMGLMAIGNEIEKDGNTLIIDGGDTIQGSPFVSYVEKNPRPIHPMTKVMNAIGYDYVTIGNHDFNYGQGFLSAYLDHLDAKVLCGNIFEEDDLEAPKYLPWDIKLMDNGLRVGLIGMTTDFIHVWEKDENIQGLRVTDAFDCAAKACQAIRDQVDVLIGLYHGGFENDLVSHVLHSHTSENQAYKIAKMLDLDLLLTGHQHMAIAGKSIFGTHIVQTPSNGVQYAEIAISHDGDRTSIHSALRTPKLGANDLSDEDLDTIQGQVQVWLDQQVGQLDLAMVVTDHMTMALEGNTVVNFLNQVQLATTGADISCTALANVVQGLKQKVTLRDVVTTYIFPNTLMVLEVSGRVLRQALERCAEYFDLEEGHLSFSDAFMKPKVAHYNYDYFSGIHYSFDLKKPLGNRVIELVFEGRPVKNEDVFKLAMNNYRATGTGGYDCYKDCPVIQDIQVSTTDMIAHYFDQHPLVRIDQEVYCKVIYDSEA